MVRSVTMLSDALRCWYDTRFPAGGGGGGDRKPAPPDVAGANGNVGSSKARPSSARTLRPTKPAPKAAPVARSRAAAPDPATGEHCYREARCTKSSGHAGWCNAKGRTEPGWKPCRPAAPAVKSAGQQQQEEERRQQQQQEERPPRPPQQLLQQQQQQHEEEPPPLSPRQQKQEEEEEPPLLLLQQQQQQQQQQAVHARGVRFRKPPVSTHAQVARLFELLFSFPIMNTFLTCDNIF